MNNIKRITALVMAMLMSILMLSGLTNVKAAQTAHVSISSASASVGDEVTITITASSDVKIELCDIWIDYDESILQYVKGFNSGGGGTGRLLSFDETSFNVVFKAINPGTAMISVNKSTSYTGSADEDYMSLTTSSGTVTVKAPASYSSDNTLKSLQISPGTLSPAFSPDRTTYNATVDSDVTELVVSAVANDSAAKVSISGRRMDPGSNTTTITVTAEDGSVKKYVIYTTRLEDGQEATTEAESKTEEVTETSSQTVNDDGTVTIDGNKYSVVKATDADTVVKADNSKTFGGNRFWLTVVMILGVIIVAFIVVTIILAAKLSKVKKVFNMASKDGVDLDEYTEKEIEEYDEDGEDDEDAGFDADAGFDEDDSLYKSYGDDKSGRNDVEELKLFDIDDEDK